MSLPTDIANSSRRLRELAGEMRGHLNELRAFVAGSERAGQVLTNAKALLACVQAECTSMETTLAAARMTGRMEGSRQEAEGTRVRVAMIESLHRAGDHSLDDGDLFAQAAEGQCPTPQQGTQEGAS